MLLILQPDKSAVSAIDITNFILMMLLIMKCIKAEIGLVILAEDLPSIVLVVRQQPMREQLGER